MLMSRRNAKWMGIGSLDPPISTGTPWFSINTPDLLREIGAEKVRPRHGRLVHTRPCNEAVGEARVEPRMDRDCDPYKWVGGAHARPDKMKRANLVIC